MGTVERISLSPEGLELNAPAFQPTVSADGRYILFVTCASNLLPGIPTSPLTQLPSCTNALDQWYVFDRVSRIYERVSVNNAGQPAMATTMTETCRSTRARGHLSRDARFVTYDTCADNLDAADTNLTFDTYQFDRATKRVRRIPEVTSANSDNGQVYVVGCLGASPTDTYCLLDLRTNQKRALLDISGNPISYEDISPFNMALNVDGRFLVYVGNSSSLIPGVGNGMPQVVRWNLQTNERLILSVRQDGALSSGIRLNNIGSTKSIAISDDGSVVAFAARDGGRVDAGYNSVGAVWRAATGRMESAIDNDTQQPRESFAYPSLSADGDLLVFYSTFGDPTDFIVGPELWLRRNRGDGKAGQFVRRLDQRYTQVGHGESKPPTFPLTTLAGLAMWGRLPIISASGNLIVFTSRDWQLVAGDSGRSNADNDVDVFAVPVFDDEAQTRIAVPSASGTAQLWLVGLILSVGMWAARRLK